jgi:hypothetical protein
VITILTGFKKNVGDILIGHRSKKLLKRFVDKEIVELNRFESISNKLKSINSSRALILCGGPAYDKDIFPNIYPISDFLADIKVPIIPFGLGWSGRPFHREDSFVFSKQSLETLKFIHERIGFSSCRDVITKKILENNGIRNVLMTGCPVWYSFDNIGKQFLKPKDIKKIVFTPPARARLYKQNNEILRQIRKKFPKADIYCCFHRGILPDSYTPVKASFGYVAMATYAKLKSAKVIDVSSSLNKIEFYSNCDLHIGYRVHAHLQFLSNRIPSLLINEDGRGEGMAKSLSLPVINFDEDQVSRRVSEAIDNYLIGHWGAFEEVGVRIDKSYEDMQKFLKSIK